MKTTIHIPTIKDDNNGYDKILRIANIIFKNPKQHFDFDFSQCAKIEHNSVVMLGALARYVDYHNTTSENIKSKIFSTHLFSSAGVMFLVDSMSSIVSEQLINNNFLSHFSRTGHIGYATGGYIGYREHNNILDADKIAEHLQSEWLSAGKLHLSDKLKSAIISKIFEIFMNAYGHGVLIQNKNKLGVYSCGQYDKKEKKLNISVLDFGPGIITNVKTQIPDMTDSISAMKWALTKGNSTQTDSQSTEIPRGLGFELLLDFVQANDGELRIYSNDIRVVSTSAKGVTVEKSAEILNGTLVSIKINCDDRYYRFSSEAQHLQQQYF